MLWGEAQYVSSERIFFYTTTHTNDIMYIYDIYDIYVYVNVYKSKKKPKV